METHGCKVCVLRLHNRCFHCLAPNAIYSFKTQVTDKTKSPQETEVVHIGYCPEYMNYILSFAEPDDSVSAMWEKFYLSLLRIETDKDYAAYCRLQMEIAELEAKKLDSGPEFDKLQMKKNAAKLWWHKLNMSTSSSLGKVADREKQKDNITLIGTKINLTQIHRLANNAQKSIEKKDD